MAETDGNWAESAEFDSTCVASAVFLGGLPPIQKSHQPITRNPALCDQLDHNISTAIRSPFVTA
jgi:hypothetical protein